MENTANKKTNGTLLAIGLVTAFILIVAGATGVSAMFLHFIACISGR